MTVYEATSARGAQDCRTLIWRPADGDRRRGKAFTHVELRPVQGASDGGSWELPGDRLLRTDRRSANPDGLRLSSIAAPVRHRRDSRLGARQTSRAMAWLWPASTARRLRAQRSHAGRAPDWGTLILRLRRRSEQLPWSPTRSTGVTGSNATGCAWNAVASMLTWTTRARPAVADRKRRRSENLTRSHACRKNATVYACNRADHDRRGVRRSLRLSRSRPTPTPGLRLKVKQGWMHDTLSYIGAKTIPPAVSTPTNDVRRSVCLQREIRARSARRGLTRQASSTKAPGDGGNAWPQCARLLRVHGAFPGKQLIFMGTEIADDHEWNEGGGLPWGI